MHGNVSFLELGVPEADVSKTQAFFTRVFGWTFTPMPRGGWFQAPSIRVGLHGNDTPAQIYVFLEVPDLEAAMNQVREAGGEADPANNEQGFGRFSFCRDPQGIRFGLHQR
jgi:predicted enzyme related to lactoylglutathione lyase